jgi:hypothetical protein
VTAATVPQGVQASPAHPGDVGTSPDVSCLTALRPTARVPDKGDDVRILAGKFKGRMGTFVTSKEGMCWVETRTNGQRVIVKLQLDQVEVYS